MGAKLRMIASLLRIVEQDLSEKSLPAGGSSIGDSD
jgi:hypothetical protein